MASAKVWLADGGRDPGPDAALHPAAGVDEGDAGGDQGHKEAASLLRYRKTCDGTMPNEELNSIIASVRSYLELEKESGMEEYLFCSPGSKAAGAAAKPAAGKKETK